MGLRLILVGSERIFLKYLEEYDSISVSALFFIVASITLLPIFFVVDISSIPSSINELGIGAISALIYSIGFYSYVKAISEEDASLIAPLYSSSLLWLLILGSIFLGEDVTILRILGSITMFIGLFFLYSGGFKEKILAIKSSRASILMIIGSLFIALGRAVDTYAIRSIDERLYAWVINFYIGMYMLILTLVMGRKNTLIRIISENPKKMLLAGFTNGWGYLMLLIAIIGLQVTVAEPATLLSVFVTAFLAKRFLHENVEERIPGMIMMFIGAVLLFI